MCVCVCVISGGGGGGDEGGDEGYHHLTNHFFPSQISQLPEDPSKHCCSSDPYLTLQNSIYSSVNVVE